MKKDLLTFSGNNFKDKIKAGAIWIYLPTSFDIKATDILCKIIRVTDTHVYLIRKTKFGFEDIAPLIVDLQTFIDCYMYLGEGE